MSSGRSESDELSARSTVNLFGDSVSTSTSRLVQARSPPENSGFDSNVSRIPWLISARPTESASGGATELGPNLSALVSPAIQPRGVYSLYVCDAQ